MKDESIERRIAEAFRAAAPDIKETLLSELRDTEKGAAAMNTKENPKKDKKNWLRYAALAACLLLAIGLGFGAKTLLARSPEPAACVMIDVNPSIELLLDQNDRVLSAEAKNGDGEKILAGMDLAGTDAKLALNAVIGAMVRQGYLSELANSVLITVDSADGSRSLRLREALSEDARDYLQGSGLDCAILGQTLEPGGEDAAAERYGISPGKARLVKQLAASNPRYDPAGLAALSINELSLLCGHNAVQEVHAYGRSSDKAYIGREAAEELALGHAGIARSDAAKLEAELEYEAGSLVYELEFEAAGKEYEYEVDAVTGEILKFEAEVLDREEDHGTGDEDEDDDPDGEDEDDDDPDDDPDDDEADDSPAPGAANQPEPADPPLLSADQALEIALGSVGTDRAHALQIETELDRERGALIYEVEFKLDGIEHDFEIDAATGEILKHETEPDD